MGNCLDRNPVGAKNSSAVYGLAEEPSSELPTNQRTEPPLGLYLHVPFCSHSCDFCAFYQEAPRRADLERYLHAIELELRLFPPGRRVQTVFWGGGTPGLLPAGDVARLGAAMLRHTEGAPTEWTVEMAPATVKEDKLRVMRDLGVTRISLGVQSFDDRVLSELGRRHSAAQVMRAIDRIRHCGFENLNIDLMFAIPGQDPGAWDRDLRHAIACAPEHLSTYCLTFEEDTRLWARLRRGEVRPCSESEEYVLYEHAIDLLEDAGYRQYEISNYSHPGFACQHNVHTWEMGEWVGYGPAAASQFQGIRFANPESLDRWYQGVEIGRLERVDRVVLDDANLAVDAVIFGLRMNAGINLNRLRKRWPRAPWGELESLWTAWINEGLACHPSPDRLALTRRGRLVADAVAREALEVLD